MTHPLDPSNLRQMIVDGPDQFKTGFELAKEVKLPGNFTSICISGMGGSALPADLLRIYIEDLFQQEKPGDLPLPIYQNRFYALPPEAYKNCLNFICSYSGNTEETIASFEEALAAKLPCVGLSGGGKIEEMCQARGIPHIKLPVPTPDFQPRMGTGYFFSTMLQVLVNHGMVPDKTTEILSEAEAMKSLLPAIEEEGKQLAQKIKGKTPIIHASSRFKTVAMVWKIKMNENAKTPAYWNFFPELNHNEMVGYTNPQAEFAILMLRDPSDDPRNLKRFEVTAKLLREKGISVEILDMKGQSVYSKVFVSIALGDFTSYFLALEYGQDPTPVDMVEDLKKLLKA